jgi:hypothetical protein
MKIDGTDQADFVVPLINDLGNHEIEIELT